MRGIGKNVIVMRDLLVAQRLGCLLTNDYLLMAYMISGFFYLVTFVPVRYNS